MVVGEVLEKRPTESRPVEIREENRNERRHFEPSPPSSDRSLLALVLFRCEAERVRLIEKIVYGFLSRAEMTKRPFPFEPSICRQSKTHLNNYENDTIALNDMKERTLKKLFEGPRKLHSIVLNNGESLCSVENDRQSKNNNLMQKLLTNYITVNGRKMNEDDRMTMRAADSSFSCFFCETRTDPVHQCIQCLEFYCSNCSFVNYDTIEDRSVCLSCS